MRLDELAVKSVPILSVGSTVNTTEGPGEIVDIVLQVAKYGNKWELDPPALVVLLEDGRTINTCMCSITVPESKKATALLRREYKRLWPPVDVDGAGYLYGDEDQKPKLKRGKE